MSHHLYKKAMEYDLEEIQLLAKAAQTAPPVSFTP